MKTFIVPSDTERQRSYASALRHRRVEETRQAILSAVTHHLEERGLREAIRGVGGQPIEGRLLGDGVLAVFTSARQAIAAAMASARIGDDAGMSMHLGIHAGDVIHEAENVFGGAVNIAARISALSEPGEVLVSDTVRALARTSACVWFADRGESELKGVSDPVRLYAVTQPAGPDFDELLQTVIQVTDKDAELMTGCVP